MVARKPETLKICLSCNKEFNTSLKNKLTCSASCSKALKFQRLRDSQNFGTQKIAQKDVFKDFPNLSNQALNWNPHSFEGNFSESREWICPRGHVHIASIKQKIISTQSKFGGCPICSNRKILVGFNDLASTHPEIAKDADGWDPTGFSAGSEKIVQWRCELGHEWSSTIHNRAISGRGCATCSGRKVLSGFNDLATTHPIVASEAFGWDPTAVTHGSERFENWKCSEGHVWNAIVQSRASGKNDTGCPTCATTGFKPGEDGYLYLMKNEPWNLYKIGISNSNEKRTNVHKRTGWELVDMIGPIDGSLAQNWERTILNFLKEEGAVFSGKSIAGNFSGHTETWTVDSFSAFSIKDILKMAKAL